METSENTKVLLISKTNKKKVKNDNDKLQNCSTTEHRSKNTTCFADIAAKIIRTVTLAPFICFIMLTILYFCSNIVFKSALGYWLAVLFLVAFPILAYPIHAAIPKLRATKRKGQRTLAIAMSVLGYVGGIISAVLIHESKALYLIYITYFISSLIIAFLSFVIKFKASGHFCGLTGPIIMLAYLVNPLALVGLALIPALIWGTLRLKQHTVRQMIVGSIVPIVVMTVSWLFLFH